MRTVLPAHYSTVIGKNGAFSRPIDGVLNRKVLRPTRIPRAKTRRKDRVSAMSSTKGMLAENKDLIFTSLSHMVVETYHQNEGLRPIAEIIGGPDAEKKAKAILLHLAETLWVGSVATAFSTMRNRDEDLRQLHIDEITEWRALHKPVDEVIGVSKKQRKARKGAGTDVRDTDRVAATKTRAKNQFLANVQLAINLTDRANKTNMDHNLSYAQVAVAKLKGQFIETIRSAAEAV